MTSRHCGARRSAVIIASGDSPPEGPPQVFNIRSSKTVRRLVVWLLRIAGYRALAAESGVAAEMLCNAKHPTLILSDADMRLGDGWEMLMFRQRRHPQIPVVLVNSSALRTHPEIERWSRAHVSRRFDSRKFRSQIMGLLAHASPAN